MSQSPTANDASILARAQGCLLGQLAGDALGSLVEFEHPEVIRSWYCFAGIAATGFERTTLEDFEEMTLHALDGDIIAAG